MRDVLPTLRRWQDEGKKFALATVVSTWGSSPRPAGASMGITDDGAIVGSVSGGCVESAVAEAAIAALATGAPKLLEFGALEEDALWEVGLSCGGRIRVWVWPEPNMDPSWLEAARAVEANQACVLSVPLSGIAPSLWFAGGPAGAAAAASRSRTSREEEGVFYQVLARRSRLLVIGAVHIAIPLVQMARLLGFETVLVDPRPALTALERFPVAPDVVLTDWPQRVLGDIGLDDETFAVSLSHDPKIDDAALRILLRSPVACIGCLGSRSTQSQRRERLLAEGFTEAEVGRIKGPVGLDIGARSPEEIALSILAEVVQVHRATR